VNEDDRVYHEEMEWLGRQLTTIHGQVQHVADRLRDGAILRYPDAYHNAELFDMHHKLTQRSEEIIDRMQALHKLFNEPTTPE
jgi:hypothetical protein